MPLDRAAQRRADALWLARCLADPASRVLAVWRNRSLVVETPDPAAALLAAGERWAGAGEVAFLGLAGSRAHFAVDLSHLDQPPDLAEGARFVDLRAVGPLLSQGDGALLAYARGLMHWHARHRFCGACGGATASAAGGHVRRCPSCGAEHFPRTDPAVIMLVEDGSRVLLARQASWPPGRHSVLAGFVEPGESLEEAVRREVMEEVGIAVAEVRYRSSQPWPFPASIMLGFTARAMTRDIRLAAGELEAARWMSRSELLNLPDHAEFRLPSPDSIARRLIEDWLAGA